MSGTIMGVDYSGRPPSPGAILAAGYQFAGAYYCPLPNPKALTPARALELSAAGIRNLVFWESTAARATEGAAAGAADVAEAVRQARACGQPAGSPIFFTVDTDVDAGAVAPYFQEIVVGCWPYVAGGYGSLRLIEGLLEANLIVGSVQTAAWSGGLLSPHAWVYQHPVTVTIDGTYCDVDQALVDDYGGWLVGQPDNDEQELFPMAIFKNDDDARAWFVRDNYRKVLSRGPESPEVQAKWAAFIEANGADLFLAAIMDSGEGAADLAHLRHLEAWAATQSA